MDYLLIVGAGSIGRRHLGNFKKHGVKNIGCVDPNKDRLNQASEVCDVYKTYTDHLDAVNEKKYEAVVIASPTSMHVDQAITFASKGIHIFMEKPVSHNLRNLDKLSRIVKEKKIKFFTAYCHRFIPSVIKLKELIDSNILGKIYSFNANWGSYLPNWHPWEDYRSFYMAKKSQGGGALLDESHGIDLIRYLFGEISSVAGDVDKISHLEIDSDDWAAALLIFKNNIRGKVHFDLIRHDPQIKIEILCEHGSITWDRIDHQIKVFDSRKKSYEVFPYTLADILSMYDEETIHFINCIKNNKQSLIDLEDGIKTMKVVDAIFKSSEKGKRVFI